MDILEMPNIKVLRQNDKQEWTNTLKRMVGYDFYHTYSYNDYYNAVDSQSVLFCFEYENTEIVFPMIVRNIENSEYKDVTSSYGYVGPLSSIDNIPETVLSKFWKALNSFFEQENIIAAFTRMHPSLDNYKILEGVGTVIALSETVYIDLTLPIDEQRHQYRKSVKSLVNKLKRTGFNIVEDKEKKHIDEFIEIYNENMDRVNAKEEYYFDRAYYEMIFKSDDIDSRLFFIEKDGSRIATSIFVYSGNIIQYHLSAIKDEYLRESPIRLLLDHIRLTGSEEGYKELHLGGGVGSKEDSLFLFKAGFSNCRRTFRIWKHIVNQEAYNKLLEEKEITEDNGFFPLYRSK